MDFMAKLLLIGDGAVGKTSLRKRYLGHGFNASHLMTIGADFASKTIVLDSGIKFVAQIWDLAGQEQFASVRQRFFLGASAVMLVFDVTNRDTFFNIPNWLQELFSATNNAKVPIILVGNKVDLEDHRVVRKEDAEKYLQLLRSSPFFSDIPMAYIETSAKDGTNVEDAFQWLAKTLVESDVIHKPRAFGSK